MRHSYLGGSLALAALAGCQALSGLAGLDPGPGSGGASSNSGGGAVTTSSSNGGNTTQGPGGAGGVGGTMNTSSVGGAGGGMSGVSVSSSTGVGGAVASPPLAPQSIELFDCTAACAVTGIATDGVEIAAVGYFDDTITIDSSTFPASGSVTARTGFLTIFDGNGWTTTLIRDNLAGFDRDVVPTGVTYDGSGWVHVAGNFDSLGGVEVGPRTISPSSTAGQSGFLYRTNGAAHQLVSLTPSLGANVTVFGVKSGRFGPAGMEMDRVAVFGTTDTALALPSSGSQAAANSGFWIVLDVSIQPDSVIGGGYVTDDSTVAPGVFDVAFYGGDVIACGQFRGNDAVVNTFGGGTTITENVPDATGQQERAFVTRRGPNVSWHVVGHADDSGDPTFCASMRTIDPGVLSIAGGIRGKTTFRDGQGNTAEQNFNAPMNNLEAWITHAINPDTGLPLGGRVVAVTNKPSGVQAGVLPIRIVSELDGHDVVAGTFKGDIDGTINSSDNDGFLRETRPDGSLVTHLIGEADDQYVFAAAEGPGGTGSEVLLGGYALGSPASVTIIPQGATSTQSFAAFVAHFTAPVPD